MRHGHTECRVGNPNRHPNMNSTHEKPSGQAFGRTRPRLQPAKRPSPHPRGARPRGTSKATSPAMPCPMTPPSACLGSDLRYVSRGGLKLEAALDHWHIDLARRFCLASAPPPAALPTACCSTVPPAFWPVHTGYGQIAQTLRDDARVTLMERTNARLLTPATCPLASLSSPSTSPSSPPPSFFHRFWLLFAACRTVRHASDAVRHLSLEAVILIKPQFEAGRERIGKGGIVRDPAAHQLAIDRVRACVGGTRRPRHRRHRLADYRR